ncbi:MAG: anthranilate synthase component II [Luteibaculaceae bacterium]
MPLLVLDNYDSFVYNLVHMIHNLGETDITVVKNDKISLEEVNHFDKILLSPGPGIPEQAGIMPALLKTYAHKKSILGVCLGHQAIGEAFGAKLHNLALPLHGVSSTVELTENTALFSTLPKHFGVAHYHSWVVDAKSIENTDLLITAQHTDGYVMALQHKSYKVFGLQFHPESVLTEHGKIIIQNWLNQ